MADARSPRLRCRAGGRLARARARTVLAFRRPAGSQRREWPTITSTSSPLAIIPIHPTSPAGQLTIGGRSVLDATVRALRAVPSIGSIVLALEGVDAGDGDEPSPIRIANALADRVRPDFDVKHADLVEVVDGKGRIRRIFHSGSRLGHRPPAGPTNTLSPARGLGESGGSAGPFLRRLR